MQAGTHLLGAATLLSGERDLFCQKMNCSFIYDMAKKI